MRTFWPVFVSVIVLLALLAVAPSVSAQTDGTAEPVATPVVTPEIEARARELGKTLRCVVCQSESIEASDATLAADMRALVRREMADGATDAQVTAMMRDRYGDYVLLKPPVQRNTLILWFAPFAALLFGVIWFVSLRRRIDAATLDDTDEGLSEAERARLRALRKS